MTQEEHNILIENNKMLKQLLTYISIKENNSDLKDFIINVIANNIIPYGRT